MIPTSPVHPSAPEPPSTESKPGSSRDTAGSSLRAAAASPVGIGVLLVGGVLAVDAGGTDDGPGLCVFRHVTGGYCPGCGLTRSASHLMRGEVGAAWSDHPWLIFAVLQFAIMVGVWGVARRRARTIDWVRPAQILAVVNAVALVSIWVIRLVDGSIPRFF